MALHPMDAYQSAERNMPLPLADARVRAQVRLGLDRQH
jgi:hypothetical protein